MLFNLLHDTKLAAAADQELSSCRQYSNDDDDNKGQSNLATGGITATQRGADI